MNIKGFLGKFGRRRKPAPTVSHLIALNQRVELKPSEVFALTNSAGKEAGHLVMHAFTMVLDRLGEDFLELIETEPDDFPAIFVFYCDGSKAVVVTVREARLALEFYNDYLMPLKEKIENSLEVIGPTATTADVARAYYGAINDLEPPN